MARDGRLRDTMILDQLIRLAQTGAEPYPRGLDEVAHEYAGLTVDKDDPCRRRYAEPLGTDWRNVDRGFSEYAIGDAIATIGAYHRMVEAATDLQRAHADLYDLSFARRWGPRRCSAGVSSISTFPMSRECLCTYGGSSAGRW